VQLGKQNDRMFIFLTKRLIIVKPFTLSCTVLQAYVCTEGQ